MEKWTKWVSGDVTLYLGDCLEVLPTLEIRSVDAVVTDPPWGIGYASSRTTRSNGKLRVNDASFGPDVFDPRWLVEVYWVTKPDSALYMFTRWDVAVQWKQAIEDRGYKVVQRLVWDKAHWKMGDLRYYGSQTEDVLFCRKGAPMMYYEKRRGNLWRYSASWLPEGQYNHPTQKPEALIREFITDCTLPDAVVLDPFMGSGTTGVACVQTKRKFIGIEIEEKYFDIAKERILKAQNEMIQDSFIKE